MLAMRRKRELIFPSAKVDRKVILGAGRMIAFDIDQPTGRRCWVQFNPAGHGAYPGKVAMNSAPDPRKGP
jgi:hypothetical protein